MDLIWPDSRMSAQEKALARAWRTADCTGSCAETNTIGIFFRFDEAEANGITIREYGFFGGDVQYVESVTGDLAMGGVFHQDTNPTGEVLHPGYLYEVKNIPDFNKISDTRVELVGIIKI
ncbi:hypothetical protein [Dichelobacter nodosus]|nr:hypothetical protein [Dichelobacter nodosus]